ncbi:hypothetical protein [Streptomyces sp. NPDC054940]
MRLVVSGEADVDQAELDALTSQLRQRLLELDIDDVRLGRSDEAAPEGAKPGELIAVGALAVSLAPVVLRPALRLIETWMQNRPVRTVTVDIDGRILEIGHASKDQQQHLLDLYAEAVRSAADARSNDADDESTAGSQPQVAPVAPDAQG